MTILLRLLSDYYIIITILLDDLQEDGVDYHVLDSEEDDSTTLQHYYMYCYIILPLYYYHIIITILLYDLQEDSVDGHVVDSEEDEGHEEGGEGDRGQGGDDRIELCGGV